MSREKLKQIFIEEANEIIEKMDIDIINYEESPSDKTLLNEIFRGVHTLKGSANAFNFSRLGEFVHHFEDVLDYFRNSDEIPTASHVDVFLESVTIIRESLECEVNQTETLPQGYGETLEKIRRMLQHVNQSDVSNADTESSHHDLADEFGNEDSTPMLPAPVSIQEELFWEELKESESLFKITLHLDTDIYLRGFDHFIFFKNLERDGRILSSFWSTPEVETLDALDVEQNRIKEVVIYYASLQSLDDVIGAFLFLEDEEYIVEQLEKKPAIQPEAVVEETLHVRNEPTEVKGYEPPKETKEIAPVNNAAATLSKTFLKIDAQKLDELFDSIGELVIAQNSLAENRKIKAFQDAEVSKTIENLSKITRLIQNRVMSLRMIPIRDTFEKMKRVVRDSSKKVNKPIHLVLEGEDTEIDKTMVEAIADPLVHIIRNSIDHGIEVDMAERVRAGKGEEGVVTLSAYHRGGNIIIEVKDDGRGINKHKVFQKAIERGLVKAEDELSDAQIYNLIMQPGFSTADTISDISGRGVGLDVVRTSIERVRGKIDIISSEGQGSIFRIVLPLTLAIIDGMIVKSEERIYIIPTLSIIESFRPHEEHVHIAGGKDEFVQLRDELLPIVRLNRVLDINESMPSPCHSTLVCIENQKGKFALLVDELVGRQQVVIKTLGEFLTQTVGVSGGAVMGNGEVALILNVEELFG